MNVPPGATVVNGCPAPATVRFFLPTCSADRAYVQCESRPRSNRFERRRPRYAVGSRFHQPLVWQVQLLLAGRLLGGRLLGSRLLQRLLGSGSSRLLGGRLLGSSGLFGSGHVSNSSKAGVLIAFAIFLRTSCRGTSPFCRLLPCSCLLQAQLPWLACKPSFERHQHGHIIRHGHLANFSRIFRSRGTSEKISPRQRQILGFAFIYNHLRASGDQCRMTNFKCRRKSESQRTKHEVTSAVVVLC